MHLIYVRNSRHTVKRRMFFFSSSNNTHSLFDTHTHKYALNKAQYISKLVSTVEILLLFVFIFAEHSFKPSNRVKRVPKISFYSFRLIIIENYLISETI